MHGRTYSCNHLLINLVYLVYLLLTNMLCTLKEFLTNGTLKVSFVRCRIVLQNTGTLACMCTMCVQPRITAIHCQRNMHTNTTQV